MRPGSLSLHWLSMGGPDAARERLAWTVFRSIISPSIEALTELAK
jgi:hypothetical protein